MKKRLKKKKVGRTSPKTINYLLKNSECFDHGFLEGLELAKMKDMYTYFSKRLVAEDKEYDKILKSLGWCIRLSEIMNSTLEGDKLWNNQYVNLRADKGDKSIRVLINIYNKLKDKNNDSEERWRNHVWEKKARRLYYLLRGYYTQFWWD